MSTDDVNTYDLLRKVKTQLDALERLLAEAWLLHARHGAPPPSQTLMDEVNQTRYEYERLVALLVVPTH